MSFDKNVLKAIYERTSGYCHICHGRLAFKNYAEFGNRGAWEVEHSNPQAKGGTHRINNLYAAHISCNRSKGARSTRSVRAKNGLKRAPLSVTKRREVTFWNALIGAGSGALVGAKLAGPHGAVLGGLMGILTQADRNPDKE